MAWLFKELVGGGAQPLAVETSVNTTLSGVRMFAFEKGAQQGAQGGGAESGAGGVQEGVQRGSGVAERRSTVLLLLNLNALNTFLA